jgi:folate-dependent phosphoribosylglycinamide formyltransferase PurN
MGTPQSGRRGGEHLSAPRIVYFGSGAFAVPPLERLHKAGYPILAVVSQPPKPAGRGMRLQPTPVHSLAESLGLPVLTPQRARDPEFIEQLRALAPDLIVLASYGKILPQAVLEIAPLGNWNLHGSLLPKYRGASPIQYALLNGERETGVTLMEMVAEMDAGDIYLQATEPIHPDDDYGALEARLAARAASLLLDGLERLQAGTLIRAPQDHAAATYAPSSRKTTRASAGRSLPSDVATASAPFRPSLARSPCGGARRSNSGGRRSRRAPKTPRRARLSPARPTTCALRAGRARCACWRCSLKAARAWTAARSSTATARK